MPSNCCKRFKSGLVQVKDLIVRKMPDSSYHKHAWKLYERVLMYRSTLAQISAFSYFFLFFIIGKEASQISSEYIESGESDNAEL